MSPIEIMQAARDQTIHHHIEQPRRGYISTAAKDGRDVMTDLLR